MSDFDQNKARADHFEKLAHTLGESITRLNAENSLLREFCEEVSLPPYRDSDLPGLLRALQTRAKWLLERTSKTPHHSATTEGGEDEN